MPLLETKGAASAQGFGGIGGGSSGPVNYIEDVFSTYLYTGNGSTQTITNGIDLSTKGGLVWMKSRSAATDHALYDTVRGATKDLVSNSQAAETTQSTGLTSFASTGFSIGALAKINTNAATYVSWTFREQPKFFDVVTYTGNGANRTIAHNLGSVPGCIIVKRTDSTGDWQVYHRSTGNTKYLVLNSVAAEATSSTRWNDTTPTSTVFSLGTEATVNANGGTYVAILFAHNAGGFGLSGTDNVISCGSYTTSSTSDSPTINLGYEPQFVLTKLTNTSGDWRLFDNMRGVATGGVDALLRPNSTAAELSVSDYITFNATGFTQSANIDLGANSYIYIAIRRGPMKVPTSGTSVFGANARSGTGANATVTGGQIADAALIKNRGSAVGDLFASRLTGTGYLETSSTAAEVAAGTTILQANPWDVMDGVKVGTTSTITNASGNTFINYLFRRAPGFFDEVCYNGSGVSTPTTVTHNLGVAPEMIIMFGRSYSAAGIIQGQVWTKDLTGTKTMYMSSSGGTTSWGNQAPYNVTATNYVSGYFSTPESVNNTFVAYLFATCAGVSKVGSYTGTGATLQINCGFTGGARFVLIKRTDSTGDWYVWDSARGIVAGNDPYILLNSTAAEVTSTDYVDTYSAGFEISSTAPAAINANGGTFVFLAIA
jgi:hypothetical protein